SYCRKCGGPVRRDTPQAAVDDVLAQASGRVQISFPLPPVARLTHTAVVENLRALGFTRVVSDGAAFHLHELPPQLDLTRTGELLILVDRLVAEPSSAGTL